MHGVRSPLLWWLVFQCLTGCIWLTGFRINASQFLGAPLYLINQDWYNAWIAFTKQSWGLLTMTMTQWWAPTTVRVSGDSTMRGQLLQTTDGSLLCNFPERMVLIANHQIYTDWLYLWWIGYTAGMHGRIYVVLKESLKRIPVIGWGMQFAQFIFLKRKWEQDKPRMAEHLKRFNNPKDPMWLMIFPEGTNLASCTRETSKAWADKNGIQDMQHTLLPRSTGLQFILQQLKENVEYVYDCTIAYEGVARGEFAQDIFTVGASYFGGRPPKSVNMYWRRFRTDSIPVDNPKKFELWLRQRWVEKDKFIEDYLRTGRFPADKGTSKDQQGKFITGAGHIEAEIKPKYWYEFLQVFAPIGLFALVLYIFYGALPNEVLQKIKNIDQRTVLKQIAAYQRGELKVPDQRKLKSVAAKALLDQQRVGGSKFRNAALAHGIVTLNGAPQTNFPTKGLGGQVEKMKPQPKKLPAKASPGMKKPPKSKPVTLNGVPIKDFPAKGLEQKPLKKLSKPKAVTLNGVPLEDFSAKGLEKAAGITEVGENGASITKPNGTLSAIAAVATSHSPSGKASSAQKLPKHPTTTTKAKDLQKKTPKKPNHAQVTKSIDQPTVLSAADKTPSKSPNANPKVASAPKALRPKEPTGTAQMSTSTTKSSAQHQTPLAAATAPSSVQGDECPSDSSEVRKARKKLELQGKQLPKRKIRRAIGAAGR